MRDNRKRKMRLRLIAVIVLGIVIISVTIGCVYFTHNKGKKQVIAEKFEKNEMTENGNTGNENSENTTKALTPTIPESWDQTKVTPVLSEDNIYVPVPKGFTISTDENERYVNGTNVERKLSSTPLAFSANASDANPWTLNGDNIWVSGNKGVNSSISELLSNEFTVGAEGGYLSIVWSVSSETNYDKLSVTAVNTATSQSTALADISGTENGTAYASLNYQTYEGKLEAGTYTLSIKYTKDGSGNSGLDSGYIKSGAIKNIDEEGTESIVVRDKSGGFVIYEGTEEITDLWTASKERNQFVWVPVPNPSRIYEKNETTGKIKAKLWNFTAARRTPYTTFQNDKDTKGEAGVLSVQAYDGINYMSDPDYGGMSGYSKDILYKELETEYRNTIKSIEKYGGFYIGRYETGNITSEIPVVRRMNSTISNVNWYKMYERMKNISNNPNIQTSMIWGSLWDETLQWLIDTGEKTQAEIAADSSSWGNYYRTTFQYYNNNGELTNTKSGGRTIPTGSAEYTKANNIYDLAGNVWDWTLEGDGSSNRYLRGDVYNHRGTSDPAHNRGSYYPSFCDGLYRLPCALLHQIGYIFKDFAYPIWLNRWTLMLLGTLPKSRLQELA